MDTDSPDILSPTPDDDLAYINQKITHSLAIDEAKGALRGIKKRARNIGVDIKAADFAESCRKKGEEGRVHAEKVIRCIFLTGLVDRAFLVNLAESNGVVSEHVLQERLLALALDDGWRDAQKGVLEEQNRYPVDRDQAAARSKGWARGAAAKQMELGLEGRAASARKEMAEARRERKTVSVVTDHANGNGSVLPNVKRPRGRPRKHPEAQQLNA